jgi:hypothetical protein
MGRFGKAHPVGLERVHEHCNQSGLWSSWPDFDPAIHAPAADRIGSKEGVDHRDKPTAVRLSFARQGRMALIPLGWGRFAECPDTRGESIPCAIKIAFFMSS